MLNALALLDRLALARVLCVGDAMLDRYVYGEATGISPEAPVPLVRVSRATAMPGGTGNVAANMIGLGVSATVVSVIGDDDSADALEASFSLAGIRSSALIRDPSRPTVIKTRVIAGIQQVVRYDEELPAPVTGEAAERYLAAVAAAMPDAGAVAMSDYGKGALAGGLAERILELAGSAGVPVVVDPKGVDYSRYAGASLVTPNRRELSEAVGRDLAGEAAIVEAGRELMRRHGIGNVLATRSEDGMTLIGADGSAVTLPSRAREVFDVSGAGDTVVAVMAAGLALGAPLRTAAELANLAAGVVVGKVGTASASPAEIRNYLGGD